MLGTENGASAGVVEVEVEAEVVAEEVTLGAAIPTQKAVEAFGAVGLPDHLLVGAILQTEGHFEVNHLIAMYPEAVAVQGEMTDEATEGDQLRILALLVLHAQNLGLALHPADEDVPLLEPARQLRAGGLDHQIDEVVAVEEEVGVEVLRGVHAGDLHLLLIPLAPVLQGQANEDAHLLYPGVHLHVELAEIQARYRDRDHQSSLAGGLLSAGKEQEQLLRQIVT